MFLGERLLDNFVLQKFIRGPRCETMTLGRLNRFDKKVIRVRFAFVRSIRTRLVASGVAQAVLAAQQSSAQAADPPL